MLERIGIVDLSLGNLAEGLNSKIMSKLNSLATLDIFSACNDCAYKPFCGIDIVDLISKEGSLDVNMLETDHCKTHMNIFDFIFSEMCAASPIFRKNLNLHLTGNYTDTHLLVGSVHD